MRITFDVVSGEHRYPLSRDGVKRAMARAGELAPEVRGSIASVRFGCSRNTTQEGRIIERGDRFDVRINFCLTNGRTPALESRAWLREVEHCGGVLDRNDGVIVWSEQAAAAYATFLLFHEIAHVVYMRRHGNTRFLEGLGGGAEEKFCDDWARQALKGWANRAPGDRTGPRTPADRRAS